MTATALEQLGSAIASSAAPSTAERELVGLHLIDTVGAWIAGAHTTEGSALQQWGEQWSILWLAHGWIFIAYVVVSFLLWRQTRWSVPFALLVMIAGLVPLVIFWVEHVVTRRIREEHPELATTPG